MHLTKVLQHYLGCSFSLQQGRGDNNKYAARYKCHYNNRDRPALPFEVRTL